jgi:hypothetical protein
MYYVIISLDESNFINRNKFHSKASFPLAYLGCVYTTSRNAAHRGIALVVLAGLDLAFSNGARL